ncbi:hypothetical protein OIV83_002601 [Microbotryomycetes sp. JL201]|nr:hypothetical protein OIV83_002601 [Microbotryomycetes sp. JL201]
MEDDAPLQGLFEASLEMSTPFVRPIGAAGLPKHGDAMAFNSDVHQTKRRRLLDVECAAMTGPASSVSRGLSVDATDIPASRSEHSQLLSSQLNTAISLTRHIDVLLNQPLPGADSESGADDFAELDMADFDCPPSSDHNNHGNSPLKLRRLRTSRSASRLETIHDDDSTERAQEAAVSSPVAADGADDSGVFMEATKMDEAHMAIIPIEKFGHVEETDEEEFEGDDMWDNVADEVLDFEESAIFVQTASNAWRQPDIASSDDFQETAEEAAANQALFARFGFAAQGDVAQAGVFQFANLKPVSMSETALKRARALLEEDKDIEGEAKAASEPQTLSLGFQVAGKRDKSAQLPRLPSSPGFHAIGHGTDPAFSKETHARAVALIQSSSPPISLSDTLGQTLQHRPVTSMASSALPVKPSSPTVFEPSETVSSPAIVNEKQDEPYDSHILPLPDSQDASAPQARDEKTNALVSRNELLPATGTAAPGAFQPAARRHPLARPLESTPSKPARSFNGTNFFTPRPAAFRSPLAGPTAKPQQKQMPAVRRLNLGMTPRKRSDSLQQKFTTPFKNGRRPENLTPAGLNTPDTENSKQSSEKTVSMKAKSNVQPVFDLSVHGERFPLKSFGMHPQLFAAELYRKMHVPLELLQITLSSAANILMPCNRGFVAAYQSLQDSVAPAECLVSSTWVQNHWSMIVWKLASYIKARPDLFAAMWRFEKVLDQLKYRYEREINQAQRSSIKRILERDSSAALPIVLCVAEICYLDEQDLSVSGSRRPSALILTDGWYRISASVDVALQNATQREKIVVGSKLVLVGSRLEGSRDGVDPLEAWTTCQLSITGNSSTLAPWHAKLGFVDQTFTASLGSLTSDGGLIAQLDVVVERLFPTGYVDMSRGGGSSETWNEAEERTRAEEWARARNMAQAKILDNRQSSRGRKVKLIERLQEAFEGFSADLAASPETQSSEESLDDVLQRLEASKNKASFISRLSATQIRGLLEILCQHGDTRSVVDDDIESELNRMCSPRDVRNFRVARIKDAQPLSKGKSPRTALLTLWDANELGNDFLKEGKRYLLSNVMPKGTWHRKTTEVTLATRRDSRWRRL